MKYTIRGPPRGRVVALRVFFKVISGYVSISVESGDIVQDGPECTCVKGV